MNICKKILGMVLNVPSIIQKLARISFVISNLVEKIQITSSSIFDSRNKKVSPLNVFRRLFGILIFSNEVGSTGMDFLL